MKTIKTEIHFPYKEISQRYYMDRFTNWMRKHEINFVKHVRKFGYIYRNDIFEEYGAEWDGSIENVLLRKPFRSYYKIESPHNGMMYALATFEYDLNETE